LPCHRQPHLLRLAVGRPGIARDTALRRIQPAAPRWPFVGLLG